ncbi:transketolase family protein [Bacillota bacterium Meth-B3]
MYTNQRTAYGKTLVELGKTDPRIVALDADLCGSTMGKLFELEFPERHFEMGIAEADMVSTAAGLAQTGLIPFASTFAVFLAGRAFDQIRQAVAIGKLNVKLCGSSCGLSDFADGATHQTVEDIAIMRAIPNMVVLSPADANETVEAVKSMRDYDGPVYIRVSRNDNENITPEGEPFVIGQPKVLREGGEVTVFATGGMNHMALQAAENLKDRVCVRVVNVHTIKPLNDERIIELSRGMKGVVTCEEHSVVGGLGGAVAGALRRERVPVEFVGINDCFGSSGHCYKDVLNYYGLTVEHVERAILSFVG